MVKLFCEMKRDALCPPFRFMSTLQTTHVRHFSNIDVTSYFYCSHLVFILWGQIFLKIALGRV